MIILIVIEKDYWVTFILDYLFNENKWREYFTFKGGTSLSKCFGLIERFSEDIDLILDWRVLGYEEKEPWIERSNTKQDKFNKEVNEKTEIFLKDELLKVLEQDLKNLGFEFSIESIDLQTIEGMINNASNRTSKFQFKEAVEINVLTRIVASMMELDKDSYDKMRRKAVEDVKASKGIISAYEAQT